jgi:PST family polysaccharide transporter
LAATIIGVAAIYRYGITGVLVAVLLAPLMVMLLAFWFGRDLPGARWTELRESRLTDEWRSLASIGVVVMLTNSIVSINELAIRAIVANGLGLDFAGLYVACHAIVSVNLSLTLNAIAADYYPRISKVADDTAAMTRTLNEQLHIALLLAGPVLIAVSVAAPLVLTILYSGAFARADLVLRLLIAAGVLRIATWSLGFVLLARRAASGLLIAEIVSATAIPIAWLLLPRAGLVAVGVAALVASVANFFAYYWQVRLTHGVKVDGENMKMLAFLLVFLSAIAVLFEINTAAAVAVGVTGALVLAWRSFKELRIALSV